MNEEIGMLPGTRLDFLQRVSIFQLELRDSRATQRFQIRTASGELTKVVRNRSQVRARRDKCLETGECAVELGNLELPDLDRPWLQRRLFALARKLVSGHALDLLGRK